MSEKHKWAILALFALWRQMEVPTYFVRSFERVDDFTSHIKKNKKKSSKVMAICTERGGRVYRFLFWSRVSGRNSDGPISGPGIPGDIPSRIPEWLQPF